jgi:hypothetical protein
MNKTQKILSILKLRTPLFQGKSKMKIKIQEQKHQRLNQEDQIIISIITSIYWLMKPK